mmetsp:Transcript_32193/g.88307  ORF Transcript_32193/g.88307 Transcript_32193/m.88307 type:complete len:275 (+) Transcript_32193:281-1105(+)
MSCASASSRVQLVDGIHLGVRQVEAPQVEIRRHVGRIVGAGHDSHPTLQRPGEGDLRRRDVVRRRDRLDRRVGQDGALRAAEGAPRLQLDAVRLAERQHRLVVLVRVPLDLVHRDRQRRHVERLLQVGRLVVAQADRADAALLLQELHRPPRLLPGLGARVGERAVRAGRVGAHAVALGLDHKGEVDQQQINIARGVQAVETQHLQVVLGAGDRGLESQRARALGRETACVRQRTSCASDEQDIMCARIPLCHKTSSRLTREAARALPTSTCVR